VFTFVLYSHQFFVRSECPWSLRNMFSHCYATADCLLAFLWQLNQFLLSMQTDISRYTRAVCGLDYLLFIFWFSQYFKNNDYFSNWKTDKTAFGISRRKDKTPIWNAPDSLIQINCSLLYYILSSKRKISV
jgi:hypothetical protein